ncbi:MAG: N-acetyl-gamma-glutamyl-phosphate reductase [Vampirovibrio sp.]|nr:N-acetyl-gamma-glutamyl-phosphate reductase [Vampirovibrio sp.]
MLSVGIIGSTGYGGQELVRLLHQHPNVEKIALTSKSYAGHPYSSVYKSFYKIVDVHCQPEDMQQLAEDVDVIFLALPHGLAAEKVTPDVLEQAKVIDLGADFRLKDAAIYEQWYGLAHPRASLLAKAVYGLPEFFKTDIQNARLIGNPGCYPTASILSTAPLVKEGLIDPATLIIDAKSGVSGAGRTLSLDLHFDEVHGSFKAYKIASHRHTPEIEQGLGLIGHLGVNTPNISFTPHLVPMNRGILTTGYAQLIQKISAKEILALYEKTYISQPFVRVLPEGASPETRWVKGSNYCDIGITVDERTNRVIAVAAIDNLVKGAAGQGIQNMNLISGLPETTGLEQLPVFPA